MDSHKRSIVKAFSYRFMGLILTTSVAWFFTGKPMVAFGIALFDGALKFFAYYLHERVWNNIEFGRKKAPEDYVI